MSANSKRKEIINNGGESEKMIDRNENVNISDEAKNEKEKNHTDEAHSRLSEIGENIIKTVKHGLDTLSSTITTGNVDDDQGSSTQNRNSQNGDSHQSSSPTQNGDSHQSSSPTQNGDSHQSSSPTNLTETEH
ncbi:12827_t:CDS:2, partial [Gigaspora rosea]